MIFLTFFKFIATPRILKKKTDQPVVNQLIEKKQLLDCWNLNNNPKTHYNLLHWSILEMNSGRDINMNSILKTKDTVSHFELTPINRYSAILHNRSIV